jgi:AcrR family transcriptional regulator
MARRANKIRTNDPQAMRAKMLDAAARAFQSGGYGATSMHDLQHAAKVSGGALHHHFPTKKDLALAVIAERVAPEVFATWINTVRRAPTAAEGISAVFEARIAELDSKGRVLGCPLNNLAVELSLADDDFRGAIAGEYELWRTAIAERLSADLAKGEAQFAKDDPAGFAAFVIAIFSGAMSVSKAEQSSAALSMSLRYLKKMMSAH